MIPTLPTYLLSGFGCPLPFLAGYLWSFCVCVRGTIVSNQSWLGCAVYVCVLGLGLRLRAATPGWGVGVCVLLCTPCLYTAIPGWGLWCVGCVLPGTCSCAVVHCQFRVMPGFAARWSLLLGTRPCAFILAGGVPLWRAPWPRVGAPRLVRSGRPWCCSWLFGTPCCLSPP